MNSRGSALPLALLLMTLLGALSGAALLWGRLRRQAGERALDRARLEAMARGEIEQALSRWGGLRADTLPIGGVVPITAPAAPAGIRVSITMERLGRFLYLLRSSAERVAADGTELGRFRLGYVARLLGPLLSDTAAILAAGPVELGAASLVDGHDAGGDAAWAPSCPPPGPPAPGIRGPGPVTDCPGGCLLGLPPHLRDTAVTVARLGQLGAVTLGDLRAAADQRAAGTTVTPAPVIDSGECDRLAAGNWGDPGATGGPCTGWFPIIEAAPGTTVRGGVGQGLLIGKGALRLTGALRFRGIVVAGGPLRIEERVDLQGVLIALDSLHVGDQVAVRWSHCAVMVAGAATARPGPGLEGRFLPGL